MFAGGTGPNPTEPMSVAAAIDEVFGAVRPRPSATAELRVRTWYEATATTTDRLRVVRTRGPGGCLRVPDHACPPGGHERRRRRLLPPPRRHNRRPR